MAGLLGKLKGKFRKAKNKIADKAKSVFDKYGRRKEYAKRDAIAKKTGIELETDCTSQYRMLRDIEKCPLYKKEVKDETARDYINESVERASAKRIVPGQLIVFNYFEPKTKEDLEYYDASPCTIFFNVIKTKNGVRILGFNLHYFPPKIRFRIMDIIFSKYRAMYGKHFTTVMDRKMDNFDYVNLTKMLENMGMGFGVREYIPELCKDVRPIPPNMWKVAAYTEGWFKKRTREQILGYWKKFMKAEGSGKDRARAAQKSTEKDKKKQKRR